MDSRADRGGGCKAWNDSGKHGGEQAGSCKCRRHTADLAAGRIRVPGVERRDAGCTVPEAEWHCVLEPSRQRPGAVACRVYCKTR